MAGDEEEVVARSPPLTPGPLLSSSFPRDVSALTTVPFLAEFFGVISGGWLRVAGSSELLSAINFGQDTLPLPYVCRKTRPEESRDRIGALESSSRVFSG